jgi:cystathionine beta-lyase family protein involved in aluminum resistance
MHVYRSPLIYVLQAYVAGRRDLVQAAVVHLSAPGVDGGATFNQYKNLFQVN